MQQYRSLPFAVYDLAVYIPGGALLLMIAQYAFNSVFPNELIIDPNFLSFGPYETLNSVILAVLLLSASYLAGHLGAFFSTFVVERFVRSALSYPSEVWYEVEQLGPSQRSSKKIRQIFRERMWEYNWLTLPSILVGLAQTPLILHHIIFRIFVPVGFYTPALPRGILKDVKRNFSKTGSSIKIEKETRWEKIVEHYVANNCPTAYVRMYNYLVIYGALRLLALILIVCSWMIIVKSAFAFFNFPFAWEVDMRRVLLFVAFSTSAFFAMMAFAKFNRRYFEEGLLALLFAPSIHQASVPEQQAASLKES